MGNQIEGRVPELVDQIVITVSHYSQSEHPTVTLEATQTRFKMGELLLPNPEVDPLCARGMTFGLVESTKHLMLFMMDTIEKQAGK